MACVSCFNILLPQCPEVININAGLLATTSYKWEITDKFQKVYNGIATTDADGLLTIHIEGNADIPKGLFMSFSGSFNLKVLKEVEEGKFEAASFVIDTIEYDCAEILFVEYS